MECHHCEHTWKYSGAKDEGDFITCPSCYYKTRFTVTETAET